MRHEFILPYPPTVNTYWRRRDNTYFVSKAGERYRRDVALIVILMLYRDEVYNPDTQATGIAEINITKQRNGSLGTIYRRFYNGHFLPVDQESAQVLSTPMRQPQPRRYSNTRTDSSKMERFF
ncbi:helicase [Shigella sonnei]|nr:helicase [Shigella sonnei]